MKRLLFFVALLCRADALSAQSDYRIAAALSQVSADTLRENLLRICGSRPAYGAGTTDTIRSRRFDQPGNEIALSFIKSKMERLGAATTWQTSSSGGKNLVAVLKGRDTTRATLIGAHIDATGWPISQGADDNASGVAALLECARLGAVLPLSHNLAFVLWNREELGALGSSAFLSQAAPFGNSILSGSINLDMVGWDGNRDNVAEIHVRNIGSSLQWMQRAASANTDYQIGLVLHPIQPGSSATDAASFWNANLPAISLSEDLSNDSNPNRHSLNDTVGAIDFAYLSKIAKLALATALADVILPATALASPSVPIASVWPLPFGNAFNVQVAASATPMDIVMYDPLGRIVARSSLLKGETAKCIDTKELSQGWYMITIGNLCGNPAPRYRLKILKH